MDMHIRLNVTCSFSVTLGVDEDNRLEGDGLKAVVAEHLDRLIEASGGGKALGNFIDRIEIAEVCTDSDETIVRGTNG